jgi:hypothetical protein
LEQHTNLLTDLELTLPQHENTISALRQQIKTLIGLLRINLESYTAPQLSIISTLQEQQATSDPVPATADPLPQAPFDTPHNSHQGRFPFYAVRRGRTTGTFECWVDCHRSIYRTADEYRGFHNLDDATEYFIMAPVQSKLTIHPWLDDPLYNRIRHPQWKLYLYNAVQKMLTSMHLTGAFFLVALHKTGTPTRRISSWVQPPQRLPQQSQPRSGNGPSSQCPQYTPAPQPPMIAKYTSWKKNASKKLTKLKPSTGRRWQ